MPGRFDPRPLLRGVGQGLRKRRDTGPEAPDRKARAVLLVLPLAAAGIAAASGFVLPHADQFIAGAAVLVGALFAAFTQIASWRDRLLMRRNQTDGVDLRALDEAGAHVLFTVVVSLVATANLVVLANLDIDQEDPSLPYATVLTTLTSVGVGAFTYMNISLFVVVNLLWDAYEKSGSPRGQSGG